MGDNWTGYFPKAGEGKTGGCASLGVDEAFLDTYNLELVAGRNFSLSVTTDTSSGIYLKRNCREAIGMDRAAWERNLDGPRITGRKGVVIGVVKDFHNRSLHEVIRPVAIAMWQPKFQCAITKNSRSGYWTKTLEYIGEMWRKYIPEKPFEYRFLDENLASFYLAEQRIGTLITVFAGLAIVIACLGLFGLAAFTAEQRTKEIGIRKDTGRIRPQYCAFALARSCDPGTAGQSNRIPHWPIGS